MLLSGGSKEESVSSPFAASRGYPLALAPFHKQHQGESFSVVPTLPSLWFLHTHIFLSLFKGPCDDIGPVHVIQDNLLLLNYVY